MNRLNPMNDPTVAYLVAVLGHRVDRLRRTEKSSGASAIEWAIITGILAVIAITVGGIITKVVTDKANNIQTK